MEGLVHKQKHRPGFTARYSTLCPLTAMYVVCCPHFTTFLKRNRSRERHKGKKSRRLSQRVAGIHNAMNMRTSACTHMHKPIPE